MSSISDQFSDEEIKNADTETNVDPLEIKSEPISKWVNHKLSRGKEEKTIERKESYLREFETFVYWIDKVHICAVDDGHVVEFNDHLKTSDRYLTITGPPARAKGTEEIDISDVTRHDILSALIEFYNFLKDTKGVISVNPATKALNSFDDDEFDLTPPDRLRIEMNEMREFLNSLDSPLVRALILTLLKTGIRIGECLNIDLQCVHIGDGNGNTHPFYQSLLDEHDVQLTSEVRDKPDSLFIYEAFNQNTVIDGEKRKSGNKRKDREGSVIPLDDELKTAFVEYLLTRNSPLTHAAKGYRIPLFTKPTQQGTDRLTYDSVKNLLGEGRDHHATDGVLAEYGWYEEGADTEDNVFNHYFRHYFTDNLKHNHGVYRGWMPTGVIAYIRGDVDKSATVGSERRESTARENTYSHDDWRNWTENVEKPYLKNVYKFGVYDQTLPRRDPI